MTGKDTEAEGEDLKAGQSLTTRALIAAAIWVAVALLAGGIMLSILFRETVERNFDARLSMLLDNLIGAASVEGEGIVSLYRSMMDPRFDRPYSGWYWQISSEDDAPFRSRSLWDQDLATAPKSAVVASGGEARIFEAAGPDDQVLRIVERDIRLPGSDAVYQFAVGGDVSELKSQIGDFNHALVWWLGALGAVLLLTMAFQVHLGLRPLRRIREALSDIRSGRTRRLKGSFPREIEPLARELNALLDHNEAVVERARRHVGNLAHALKTPLSVLGNEARANRGGEAAELARLVEEQSAIMGRHVDHHLTRARAAARGRVIGARTPVKPVVDSLVRVMGRLYTDRNLEFEIKATEADPAFRGERQDLDDMLGNLLDNAGKWARSHVRVSVSGDEDSTFIAVEDDGPGIAEAVRETVFRRGARLDESVPGSGLGLAIVRDLAELCGGEASLGTSPLGGLKAELRLPRAADI